MINPQNVRVVVTVLLGSLTGLAIGVILCTFPPYGYSPLPWRTVALCAPVIWMICGEPGGGCFFWLTIGTALLYGAYAFAVTRYHKVGTACVIGFHGFFLAAFAAIVLTA